MERLGRLARLNRVSERSRRGGVLLDRESPSVPGSLAASAITPTSLVLTWAPATDNVGVVAYEVQQAIDGDPFAWLATVAEPAVTLAVTGLSASTAYRFRIRAIDGAGNVSAWSPNDIGLLATTLGPEIHYLPFDGVNDYAHAVNAAVGAESAGTAGEYCVVVKANGTIATFPQVYAHVTDTSGSPGASTEAVTAALIHSNGATSAIARTWDRAGGGSIGATVNLVTTAGLVLAMARRNGTREIRGFVSRNGFNIADVANTPTIDRPPESVYVAARVNLAAAPSNFAPLQFVSCVVLNRYPTTAEMAAYSASDVRDARTIWGAAIHAYWAASDASGTSIPARVGSVPLTIVGGLTSSSLVSL